MFTDIRLIFLQIESEFGVNLDFPGILLSLGIDATEENLVSDSTGTDYVVGEQSAGFVDSGRRKETYTEQCPVARD